MMRRERRGDADPVLQQPLVTHREVGTEMHSGWHCQVRRANLTLWPPHKCGLAFALLSMTRDTSKIQLPTFARDLVQVCVVRWLRPFHTSPWFVEPASACAASVRGPTRQSPFVFLTRIPGFRLQGTGMLLLASLSAPDSDLALLVEAKPGPPAATPARSAPAARGPSSSRAPLELTGSCTDP